MQQFKRLLRDRTGVSAIEYAMIASLIAVAAVVGITALGTKQGQQFNNVDSRL